MERSSIVFATSCSSLLFTEVAMNSTCPSLFCLLRNNTKNTYEILFQHIVNKWNIQFIVFPRQNRLRLWTKYSYCDSVDLSTRYHHRLFISLYTSVVPQDSRTRTRSSIPGSNIRCGFLVTEAICIMFSNPTEVAAGFFDDFCPYAFTCGITTLSMRFSFPQHFELLQMCDPQRLQTLGNLFIQNLTQVLTAPIPTFMCF